MKRIIVALLVGGALFGAAFGAAVTGLPVELGTAAQGTGDVSFCAGGVTGSTYIPVGYTIVDPTGAVYLTGSSTSSDIKAVNIETGADCGLQNATIEVLDSSYNLLAGGSCDIAANIHDDGGLGWDETGSVAGLADNTYGCTAGLNVNVSVASIYHLRVTLW